MKPPYFFRLSAVSCRIEDDRRVEEGEEHDQADVDQHVQRLAAAQAAP
jgi:hypothetical protein